MITTLLMITANNTMLLVASCSFLFYIGKNITQVNDLDTINFEELVHAILTGELNGRSFKDDVESIRALFTPFKKWSEIPDKVLKKAKAFKHCLPFACISIYGEKGGSKNSNYLFNGAAQYDVDRKENPSLFDSVERERIKVQAFDLSCVLLCADSPSGGIKILMNIGKCENEGQFKRLWAIGKKYLEDALGVIIDPATSAPNNNMFLTYDPGVRYDFDKVTTVLKDTLPEMDEPETQKPPTTNSVVTSEPSPEMQSTVEKIKWFTDQIVAQKMDITVPRKAWIDLGLSLASTGEAGRRFYHQLSSIYPNYSFEETDRKYTELVTKHNGKRKIGSFFHDCINKYQLLPFPTGEANLVQKTESTTNDSIGNAAPNKDDFEIHIRQTEDRINSMTIFPYLIKVIEDKLPTLIKNLTKQYANPRKKDIIYIAMINTLSGLFKNVKVAHYNRYLSPLNLSGIIVAPPAAGKGVGLDVKKAFKEVDSFIYQNSLRELAEWEADKSESKALEAPRVKYFLMALDSTSAAMKDFLVASNGSGAVLESEMSVGATIGKQWESLKSILLKNFHNEEYEVHRKSSGLIKVPLSFGITMSTTPHYAISMISCADGLASRIIPYCFNDMTDIDEETFKHENVFDYSNHFEIAGTYIREMYERVNILPDIIYGWPAESQKELLAFFRKTRERSLKIFDNDFDAFIKRTTLIASRIGAMFAFLDDYENNKGAFGNTDKVRMIPEKYLPITIKLVNRILWHWRTFYDNLDKKSITIDSKLNKIYHILNYLPSEFSVNDLGNNFFDDTKISPKTLERRIHDCCEKGFLAKVKHGLYRKTEKCPQK